MNTLLMWIWTGKIQYTERQIERDSLSPFVCFMVEVPVTELEIAVSVLQLPAISVLCGHSRHEIFS